MHSQASTMNEQDMADVAVYLAGDAVLNKSVTDPNSKAGEHRPKASEACVACHGTNGVGITADYPTIAGQHKDYIQRALTDYKKGGRKNPIMGGQVAALSLEDIEELAAYYSSQKPSLDILPVRHFFFSAK
jgi:cytochrome c553